jgi:hypothetical protein
LLLTKLKSPRSIDKSLPFSPTIYSSHHPDETTTELESLLLLEYFDDTTFEEFHLINILPNKSVSQVVDLNGDTVWTKYHVIQYDKAHESFLIGWDGNH